MVSLPVPLRVFQEERLAFRNQTTVENQLRILPVPHPTRSFWIDSSPDANPNATEGSSGILTDDADICIIGSGITGVSAAYHLAKTIAARNNLTLASDRPFKIVVLEARDFCSGATGRNGGHLTPNAFHGFQWLEASYGKAEALRAIALEHHTVSEIVNIIQKHGKENDVDLVKGDHMDLFVTPEEEIAMKADYEAAKDTGVDLNSVKWYTKEEVERTLGTPYSGVQIPGYNVWPLKFVTLLLQLTKDIANSTSHLSVTLHTSTPCTSVTSRSPSGIPDGSGRRWNVNTPRGAVACTYVLHATNGYAAHLLPFLRDPSVGIVPTRGQVIALRAVASAESLTKLSYTANEGFEYWFPRPVKKAKENPLVILGGGREATKNFQIGEVDDSVTDPVVSQVLREFLPAMFQDKYEDGLEPEMEWTGIMGFTRNGDPIVGPVIDPSSSEDFTGQYISAGYSGHGMPRAFACAEAVAQMIVMDMSGQTWSPPDWLPKHYVTSLSRM